jgi:hypothetical protein
MKGSEIPASVFEELSDRFAAQGQLRQRDHCLVLAADAALSAGESDEAERLRQKLLQQNRHHLLRPYGSMAEAMQSPDIRAFVADIRRQWPADQARAMHAAGPADDAPVAAVGTSDGRAEAIAPPTPPPPTMAPPESRPRGPVFTPLPVAAPARPAVEPAKSPYEPADLSPPPTGAGAIPPAASWLATMLFLLGLALAAGLLFFTFVWPLLD